MAWMSYGAFTVSILENTCVVWQHVWSKVSVGQYHRSTEPSVSLYTVNSRHINHNRLPHMIIFHVQVWFEMSYVSSYRIYLLYSFLCIMKYLGSLDCFIMWLKCIIFHTCCHATIKWNLDIFPWWPLPWMHLKYPCFCFTIYVNDNENTWASQSANTWKTRWVDGTPTTEVTPVTTW